MVHLTSYDENQVDVVVLRTTLVRILSRGVKHSKCLLLNSLTRPGMIVFTRRQLNDFFF